MRAFHLLATFLATASLCAGDLSPRNIIPQFPKARQLVHLPEPTSWFKDIISRRDGTLLVVRLDKPSVYLVDPSNGKYSIITTFTNATGALGIAEYAPDVFAVTIGDFNIPTLSSTPGTWRIVTLDLSKGLSSDGTVTPRLLAAVPSASNLNGLAFRSPSTLYAADSKSFQIFSIDTKTRAVGVAVPRSTLLDDGAPGLPLGVTALQWDTRGNQLFFANPNRALIGRIPAVSSSRFGTPVKMASSSETGGLEYDDFDMDPFDGNIYIVTGPSNTCNFISRDGSRQYIINPNWQGSNTTILGGTSTGWGRAQKNMNTLYITTNGEVLTGAQIIAYEFPII